MKVKHFIVSVRYRFSEYRYPLSEYRYRLSEYHYPLSKQKFATAKYRLLLKYYNSIWRWVNQKLLYYFCIMLKRIFIISLLIFSYTIVLGHNAIPHGHFDDLFSTAHHNDTHNNSDHDHHYPFSHSVKLHVAIEKQSLISVHSVKSILKKAPLNSSYCIESGIQPPIIFSFSTILFNCYLPFANHVCSGSLSNRGPPVFMV